MTPTPATDYHRQLLATADDNPDVVAAAKGLAHLVRGRLYPLIDGNGMEDEIINLYSLMNDTTPSPEPVSPLVVPDDINALLDEASIEGGPLSAKPTATSVQLVDRATGTVIREVQWDRAGEWANNVLRTVLGA